MTVARQVLANPSITTQHYLKRLADSYTLFTFLRETPDVQSATKKLFSHGSIWLDTTVLLPIFADQLEENEISQKFSHLFRICNETGIELNVTPGIIEEINAHMNSSLSCSHCTTAEWIGRTPYLYHKYLKIGRPALEFPKWLSIFKGYERPEEDIAQYLHDFFGIKRQGLLEESRKVREDLRFAADRLWTNEHQSRRKKSVC